MSIPAPVGRAILDSPIPCQGFLEHLNDVVIDV